MKLKSNGKHIYLVDGCLSFPDPIKLPRVGTGRPTMAQGHSKSKTHLRDIDVDKLKTLVKSKMDDLH